MICHDFSCQILLLAVIEDTTVIKGILGKIGQWGRIPPLKALPDEQE